MAPNQRPVLIAGLVHQDSGKTQRGLRPQPKNGSHKATKITKKSAAEIVSYLRGFVASCENQVFVLQGFASSGNLRKKTRFEG
jgi:hypothetical protein